MATMTIEGPVKSNQQLRYTGGPKTWVFVRFSTEGEPMTAGRKE